MANKRTQDSVVPDGKRIADLRKDLGLMQKSFRPVSARTVQRAEAGQAIRRDFLNTIATRLKVDVGEITATNEGKSDSHWHRVRLHRTISASAVYRDFSFAAEVKFDYQVDPDKEQAERLAKATELMRCPSSGILRQVVA